MNSWIHFKYNPNVYTSSILQRENGVCQCCNHEVTEYFPHMYTRDDVSCVCLECISDGSAAKKFNGTFISDAEDIQVTDPTLEAELKAELFERTPGIFSWQSVRWPACCNDYCAFLGHVDASDLKVMGLTERLFTKEAKYPIDILECLSRYGWANGLLFRCLHCGEYRLEIDLN